MEEGWEDVWVGELIDGRFELIDRIGSGGMAQIWLAHDQKSNQRVAVKFLRLDTEDLRQYDTPDREDELKHRRLRFIREAGLLSLLRHPNIPEQYHFGRHGELPYLAMYHVKGINLRRFLSNYAPFTSTIAVCIAAQIAAAFLHAHEREVMHRDLKPENLMISESGVVYLINFGIGKQLGIESTLTQPGSTLGTPGYRAPEQIEGDKLTAATDVYSFSCVFYELLTGRPPFTANDRDGPVERQHLRSTPLRPSDLAAGIPDVLDTLVLRGLAKDPDQRPTMREILLVLSELTPRPGDPEPRPALPYDPTRPFRLPSGNADAGPSLQQELAGRAEEDDNGGWLDQEAISLLCSAAERELEKGEPGDAVGELTGLVSRVHDEWGRRPLVRQVWELVAGGFWLAGHFGAAARLNESIADELVRGDSPQDQADRSVFGLCAARCRLESDGDTEAAIDVVIEAGYLMARLPGPCAAQVEAERRELADRVAELLAARNGRPDSGGAPEPE